MLGEEREKGDEIKKIVEGLREELVKEKEEKGKWIERCNEAEGTKERLLILVSRRGKEVAKNVQDVRVAKGRLVEEMGGLAAQLGTEQQASKQMRQALDEANRRTAELDTRNESLTGQLSIVTQENTELRKTASEAESTRAVLVQELDTTKVKLQGEQAATAQLRTRVNDTHLELASFQETPMQTQELYSNLQAKADQVAAQNLQITELCGRIKDLETQLPLPFLKRLKMRGKKHVKRFGNSIGVPDGTELIIPVAERKRVYIRNTI
ncbi:hypothetical protein N431DRAFT_459712 [Stipitochalara longipes BDJ]|nr:hypothetical protein N431DRAFT_459712 [Stipitochalara longipes BDJ]